MLYPVIIHKDEGSVFGVTVPDFPGCTTAGDTLEEALANVQEAVELYMDGEDELPAPSALEDVLRDHGEEGGAIMLVDVDLSFMDTTTQRVNITLPAYALRLVDKAAERRGMTRSAYLAEAAIHYGASRIESR